MPGKQISITEKYDDIQQLLIVGKERWYLLFDEINELLPAGAISTEELDQLFIVLGNAGIEVVESEDQYKEKKTAERTRHEPEQNLDLTPGPLEKTSDPVRMYLREMGIVPLLTREGEVEIAKRIERGKFAVLKIVSRTPQTVNAIIELGDKLKNGIHTVREIVVVHDEELSDDRIKKRSLHVLKQIEQIRKANSDAKKKETKLGTIPKHAKRRRRVYRWQSLRSQVELSRLVRRIEFTEPIKRAFVHNIRECIDVIR